MKLIGVKHFRHESQGFCSPSCKLKTIDGSTFVLGMRSPKCIKDLGLKFLQKQGKEEALILHGEQDRLSAELYFLELSAEWTVFFL